MKDILSNLNDLEISVSSPNLFLLLIDSSGSMLGYKEKMAFELKKFKDKMTAMDESSTVIISRWDFSEKIYASDFDKIENFPTNYYADGGTRLYETIICAKKALLGTRKYEGTIDILQNQGYYPEVAIIVFSDGEDEDSDNMYNLERAAAAVSKMNANDIVTAFVCFGDSSRKVAKKLNFRNIDTKYDLEEAFDAISSSCIRQSMSAVSLTDNFFDNN